MFSNANKKILAVADGEVLPLSRVPDEVFSSGMLGEGFAVEPTAGTIYSPVNGTIGSVTETKHAYTVRSADGLDILIHIGVDTVKLGGEGIISLVEEGDEVKEGDVIALAKEGTLSVNIHASISGRISAVTQSYVKITK